jgi:hypothetical protein
VAPRLNFACELAADDLTALFADGMVVEQLVALGASVTLGLLDLSAERAAVVRRLNAAGIPLTAWLLLPLDEGYWFNANNAPLAAARYDAFHAWSAEHGLVWAGVGIDVEPDTREIQHLLGGPRGPRWPLALTLLRRIVDDRARARAATQYARLVARARADGYPVHSYELPFLEDERAVGGSLLYRILGLVDVGADRAIPMLYTSFMGSRGVGFLWSYGRGKEAIIVGSTGGGVKLGGLDQERPLDWEEFARDLRLASRLAGDVGVFSLEGCVRRGFLDRLCDFDWDAPLTLPTDAAATIDRWRAIARCVLWITARPYLLLALVGLLLTLRGRVRTLKGPQSGRVVSVARQQYQAAALRTGR